MKQIELQKAWQHAFSEWHFHRTQITENEEQIARQNYIQFVKQIRSRL